MSEGANEPWDTGKVVKKNLKAKAFRKVERKEIREVEIEVVRAPLVRAPPRTETRSAPAITPTLAKDSVRQTPPQAIPLTHLETAANAAPTVTQAVVREPQKPGARSVDVAHVPSSAGAAGPRNDQGPVQGALLALADAIYKDVGHPGSILQTPRGVAFSVRHDTGAGEIHTQRAMTVPLPEGHSTSHQASLAIELENRAHLVLDITTNATSLQELKALAFDALQFRRNSRCFTILVYIRVAGPGIPQEQAEKIAHGYDLVFGIDEEHARTEQRYAALRARVSTWLSAAAKA